MTDLLTSIQAALGLPHTPIPFTGHGALPSAFAVTDLACASIGAAGQAVSELLRQQTGHLPAMEVDRRLASFWFATSLRPMGWNVPPLWDPVAGDYATEDGWIRLHTNAPHHRAAAERVLGACADRAAMAANVAQWRSADLEHAVVDANGCAAEMRSWAHWQQHPQGLAVNAEPLVHFFDAQDEHSNAWQGSAAQPLAGLKVLDLTRVLAGPTASRFLAGLGANVLRIDPPTWNEPGVIPDMTLGKRCARLDLQQPADRVVFENLLKDADILVHGYRADALEHLGFGSERRRRLAGADRRLPQRLRLERPVAEPPWLRQSGADEQRHRRGRAALEARGSTDAVAGAGAGPCNRVFDGGECDPAVDATFEDGSRWLGTLVAGAHRQAVDRTGAGSSEALRAEDAQDQSLSLEQTPWGPAHRLLVPVKISGTPLQWQLPATELGSHRPLW